MIARGSHIRVQRRLPWVGAPYWHHGIYVEDSKVIEFAGTPAQIRKVSLASFAKPQSVETVEEVAHPINWFGLTYSPLLPSEQVIDRAEWLLDNQPPPYQPGYRNCESIAVWCATNDFESFQAKKVMLWRTPITMATFVLWAKKPSIGKWPVFVGLLITMLTAVPYQLSWKLFNHVHRYPGIGNWTPKDRF